MFRLLLFILFSLPLYCTSQIITTIAGNGQNASLGDGGSASGSSVASPSLGIFDNDGNYYFTEVTTHKIRRISPLGIITTIAGTGNSGFNGDGINAVTAQLNNPSQIAVDTVGNLYIADYANHRIRKIDITTGNIATIAGTGIPGFSGDGGNAGSADLNYPFGVCIDPFGNIFISEFGNSIIRKINTSGIITTYAGTAGSAGNTGDGGLATAAQLTALRSLCSDSYGNIYIIAGDIRKIEKATGIITKVAGNGTAGYNGDNIPANSASLNVPISLTIDNYDNLIIADRLNHRIRKVENGIITTIAGNGLQGFSGDGAQAINASLYRPQGVSYDSCGNLTISDMNNFRIRKVTFNDTCGITSTHSNTLASSQSFSLYPNPTSNNLTITVNHLQTISITNTLGQVVHSQKAAHEKTIVDISHLHAGIYFVIATDKQGMKVTKKVVKE